MVCSECDRHWRIYADATKRSIDLVCQAAQHLRLTGQIGNYRVASVGVDAEWNSARESLFSHLASHHGVEPENRGANGGQE